MKTFPNLIQLTLLLIPVSSFNVNTLSSTRLNSELKSHNEQYAANNSGSRRKLFKTISATTFGIASTILTTPYANADVMQGNALPEGMAKFNGLVRVKADLKVIGKRVKEHADEINQEEWENISIFLRRLYKAGDDMKFFKVSDPEKQKKIADMSKILKKLAEAGDIPVSYNIDTFNLK